MLRKNDIARFLDTRTQPFIVKDEVYFGVTLITMLKFLIYFITVNLSTFRKIHKSQEPIYIEVFFGR